MIALVICVAYLFVAGVIGEMVRRRMDSYQNLETFFMASAWPVTGVVWLGMLLAERLIRFLESRDNVIKLPKARVRK